MRVAFSLLFCTGLVLSQVREIGPGLLAKMKTSTYHEGCPVPPAQLRDVVVAYWDYEGKPQQGELIVNQAVASEVLRIFAKLYQQKFPIEHIQPVEFFDGSDDRSMAANNTSAFNCRDITGRPGHFSNHSWGRAIDINPHQSLCERRPGAATRRPGLSGSHARLPGSYSRRQPDRGPVCRVWLDLGRQLERSERLPAFRETGTRRTCHATLIVTKGIYRRK